MAARSISALLLSCIEILSSGEPRHASIQALDLPPSPPPLDRFAAPNISAEQNASAEKGRLWNRLAESGPYDMFGVFGFVTRSKKRGNLAHRTGSRGGGGDSSAAVAFPSSGGGLLVVRLLDRRHAGYKKYQARSAGGDAKASSASSIGH